MLITPVFGVAVRGLDGAVPDACQVLHANRTNSGQSTGLHVADFFGTGVGCEVPRSEVPVTARHRLAYDKPLGTVRPIYRTGTPLPSKHPILYIFF